MEVSIERIRETVEGLCRFENRIAGTKTERLAADYLKGVLEDIGYQVLEHEFPVIKWDPKEASIALESPEEGVIDCALFPNSPNVEHRVILVPLGLKQEKKETKLPVYGFSEWGESLHTSPDTPYNNALDEGLDGLIISSPDEGDFVKVRVGNRGKLLKIPIFSVSKETGESLKKMMAEDEVILKIKSVSERGPSRSTNLEAVLEGSDSDYEIVVSAHYDAWFAGASDNAAPVAIVIEAAQQLLAYVQRNGPLKRTIRFLLYGAEESGSERFYFWLNGSRSYVESQDSLDRFALVVSLDSVGFHATNYVGTTYELLNFAQSITSAIKQEERFNHYCPPADGSDHWFFTIGGVPTIYLIAWPSNLYHTQRDIPTSLDYESIRTYAEYVVHSVLKFSDSDLLHIDVMTPIEYLKEGLDAFSNIEENPFGTDEASNLLVEILGHKETLEKLTQDINKSNKKGNSAILNDFLLNTSRRLNRTIGQVHGVHEASYLSRLALTKEYMTIDSVVRKLEEMPFMRMHRRALVSLQEQEDTPYKLLDITDATIQLRIRCKELADQIEKELHDLTDNLREILAELQALLM